MMFKNAATAVMIGLCLIAVSSAQEEASKSRDQKRADSQRQRDQQPQNQRRRMQNGSRNMSTMFQRMDKNQDGQLSADEIPTRLRSRLQGLDKDKSGSISLDELKSGMQNQGMRNRKGQQQKGNPGNKMNRGNLDGAQALEFMIKRMDKNGDGIISKDEFPEKRAERFAKLDKNGNDQLDKNEIVAVLEIMKAEGGKKGGRYNTDPSKTRPVFPKRPKN